MSCLKNWFISFLLIMCMVIFSEVDCARILGIVPTASISHQVVFRPIWKELARRGHKVVVMTTDPMNKSVENLTEINLHFSYDLLNNKHNFTEKIRSLSSNPLTMLDAIITINADICNEQLKHPNVRKLIDDENEHFDVVLIEVLQPCMFAFAHRFEAPFIGIVSMDAQSAAYDIVGNPTHPILNPDFMLPLAGELTFSEKLASIFYNIAIRIYGFYKIVPLNDKVILENFGDYPSCMKCIKYLDMLFVNVHPLLYGVRPNVPAVVNIGAGIHIQPPKPLPEDLQTFLDEADDAVVYFSLGTNVKSKDIDKRTRDVIIRTFAGLPYRFLWKFEEDDLPDKPENVKIMKWVPQQDLLRHPNVKLFITQGGLQSIEEAIFSHVPMVGMPFFADQMGNVKKMVLKGLGVMVEHKPLYKSEFHKAIVETIQDPQYRENIKKLAELLRDEPMSGLEKAVWWTEHVIRHKGAKHYRSPAVDMPFYEYFMLDVIAFFVVATFIAILVLYKVTALLLTYLFSLCCGKRKIKQH